MIFSLSINVFFSLLTGAALSIFISKWFKVKIDYILSICAGVLCGVLFLELLPHSLSDFGVIPVFLGISIGLPLMYFIDKLVHPHSLTRPINKTASFYYLVIAIILHNLPSGIALGNHVDHSNHLYHLVVYHHIPEGMTLMMIFFASSIKIHQLLTCFAVVGLSLEGFSVFGKMLPINTEPILGVLLGIAISTIWFVSMFELFYPLLRKSYRFYHFLCLLTGITIAGLIFIFG
ncbi:hypothetical protein WQ54_19960 [Bacillus sp. SA1-12]|uniref:ZIP family metal transporter n=1 Tax=Bacillus sp. SA1-12 TaxID=1455638 RepID=UPI0006271975|nr:hypothetical protein [Bacillus sp. SA1-12]KKI90257.1 hypothetical protein WQ54_19960 [Bacillus sp. SA1-12]